MRRFFKILEKIVWALVAVAIIIVLILLAIGIITNYDVAANYISSLLPYFYLVAAVFLVFEASICGMKMYLDSKIEEETKRLQSTLENHRELQVTHEEKVTGKLDKLINDIAAFPRTSTVDFVDYLNKNLHGTVLSLAIKLQLKGKTDKAESGSRISEESRCFEMNELLLLMQSLRNTMN